ncbi:hypothetical protein ACP70R_011038 [Stipagrostis hirtigluma subsp. patula]
MLVSRRPNVTALIKSWQPLGSGGESEEITLRCYNFDNISWVSMAGSGLSGNGKIRVKFLVDKEKKKVVFAESGKEFVDVLLSFLTLPIGTIVRLLGKESSLGCFDELYKSVESLDESHFQTKACKNMLLKPHSAAGQHCEDLVVRIDDTDHRKIYVCSQRECFSDVFYYSSVPDVLCRECRKSMERSWSWLKSSGVAKDDGVFVRGGRNYATTDNLQVFLANTDNLMNLLHEMGVEDVTMLEEKTSELGLEEIKNLLKRMLTSDQPLTGLLLSPPDEPTRTNVLPSMDLFKVIHAEVGEEFCNLLFLFLTLPLGHVIKLLGGSSSISCIDNLYKSVENNMNGLMNSDRCRDMVLSPMLPPFFSCCDYFLKGNEVLATVSSVACCNICIKECSPFTFDKMKCSHGNTEVLAVNPKVPTMTTETGGGYAKGTGTFLVTNELGVAPFSLVNSLRALKEKEHSISKLVATDFIFREVEVLNLLRAALVSREALTLACLPTKQKRRPHY